MWVKTTQTTDDGEPHPRVLGLAEMDSPAKFDSNGIAEVSDRDGDVLVSQLDFVEEIDESDVPDESRTPDTDTGDDPGDDAVGFGEGEYGGGDETGETPDGEAVEDTLHDEEDGDDSRRYESEDPDGDPGDDTPDDVLDATTDDDGDDDGNDDYDEYDRDE